MLLPVFFVLCVGLLAGCSDGSPDPLSSNQSTGQSGGAAGVGGSAPGAGAAGEAAGASGAGQGGASAAGQAGAGGGEPEPGPHVAEVVSFTPGPGAGFGQDQMPAIVMGPPQGKGADEGGLDVVSLGMGGEIVLRLGVEVIDGAGPDLIVFENAFHVNGDVTKPVWKDLGEVSVSEDGAQWVVFPCEPATYQQSQCAGWRPVYASSESGVSAFDPAVSGGDPFDLASVGVARARYVRIRDRTLSVAPPTAGFDLDAVAVLHAAP